MVIAISKQDVEAHYKKQYNQEIEFSDFRIISTGSIFRRKRFAVASWSISGTKPETQHEAAHQCSQSKYYVVPIVKKALASEGMLYVMTSFAAHNRYYYNTEGRHEAWRTCEVFVDVASGETDLAHIHSSGTGDTPYIEADNNIQVKSWFERTIPVYDFVIDSGLSEQDKITLNDNDIKKRKAIIYKFVLEFFNTFIISKKELKAEQDRIKNIARQEAEKKRAERKKEREIIKAQKKAAAEKKAAARIKVQMDDKDSSDKKKLMTEFLGNDIFD